MVLTIFLRLWRLDLVQFKDDQATLLRLAEDIVRLGTLPLAGMTDSLGSPLPPNFEYALAPILAVSRDPPVATAAIGLVNAAAVAGTMLFGWRRFSPLAGLVAGLVYATNPWAVFFSRKVWSNDVLAPTAVLWLFCLDNAVVGGQVGWGVAAFPVFALGVEFHPSFVLLAPLLLVLGVVMLRRRQLKHVAIGVGLAALTTLPYLIYNLQTQWSYLRAPGSSSDPQRIDGEGPGRVMGLIGGWRNGNVEGLDINTLLPLRIAAVPGAIETLLLLVGIAAAVALALPYPSRGWPSQIQAISRRLGPLLPQRVEHALRVRAAGLLLWLLVPMLLTLRHSIPLYDYYFLFVLPVGALLIGLAVHELAELHVSRRARRILVGGSLAGLIAVASVQSVLVLRQLDYLAAGYVMTYGPPLQAAEQTTRELIDDATRAGARQLSVEIDDVNDVAIGYLARPYIPEVQVVARRRGPWNVDFDLPNQSGSPPYTPAVSPRLTAPRPLDVSYADGVRILSASTTRVLSPGESVGLALTWTLDHHSPQPLSNRLVWEMALYEPSGREVRRVAGLAHDWAQLADGEVVLSWIPVATAPDASEGIYQVQVDRLHPITREPLPAVNSDAEWSAGTVNLRRK
jgi:hypothetical protein